MALFTGFFLPNEQNETVEEDSDCDGPESDSDDDFENHDFRDINRIAEQKLHCSSSFQLPLVAETLQELTHTNDRCGNKTRVYGRFDPLFSFPWWRVEIKTNEAKSSRAMKFASSLPSYSYRTDDAVGEDILHLFLKKGCGVDDQHASAFVDFIRNSNLRPTLTDLDDNLIKFADSTKDNKEIAQMIFTFLHKSGTGKAFLVPKFTRYAHRLFPRHASSLFTDDKIDLLQLQELDKALESEPWLLGFQAVLKNKFHITGCEAKISAFIECDLLSSMPVEKRDALYIYNALSAVIRKYGHTYLLLRDLRQPKYYSKPYCPGTYHVTNWEKGLAYLSEIEVVATSGSGFDDRCCVFLPHIRGYEMTIAHNLSEIMTREPWISSIKVDEKVFNGDHDQVKAAKLISSCPVVVMSGRGGCGKTFVVSSMLNQVVKTKAAWFWPDSFSDDEIDFNLLPEYTEEEQTSHHQSTIDMAGPQNSAQNLQSCDEDSVPESSTEKNETSHLSLIQDKVLLTAPTGKAAAILGRRTKIPSYTLHSVIYSFFSWLRKEDKKDDDVWKFSEVCLLVCDECSLISVRLFSTLINILMERSKLQQVILLGDVDQLPSIEPGNFLGDVYHALKPHGASIRLTTNHRTDSELIAQNAIRISGQQLPVFTDLSGGFVSLQYRSKQSDEGSNPIAQTVRELLRNQTISLPEPQKSQFVAFRRADCSLINELCSTHYNGHPIKDKRRRFDFQVGDKVCLMRNTVCFDEHEKKEVKLCNGEILFIKDIIEVIDNQSRKTRHFVLDNGEKTMKIDQKKLKKMRHAWARTIHTFQGSEVDTLVYVVGSPFYQNWQHVYTAVTRGVRSVIIINDPKNLEKAIRQSPIPRKTKLKDDIFQALKDRCPRTQPLQSDGCTRSDHTLTGMDQMDATASQCANAKVSTLPLEPPGQSSYHISRNNLRSIASNQAVREDKKSFSVASTHDKSTIGVNTVPSSTVLEIPRLAEFSKQDAVMSPSHKRKLSEMSPLMSPPETPPSFKHLPASLSSVSPMNRTSNENQTVSASGETPTKKKHLPIIAKYDSRCKMCKTPIKKGADEIKKVEGMWIHAKCTPK